MTYLGYPVLDWPDAVDTVNFTLKSKYNIIGDIWQNREVNVQQNPYALIRYTFFQDNNAERKQLRDFFKDVQGKHGQFWVRSYKNDLKLLKDVQPDDTILYCAQGYDVRAIEAHRQFLYIEGHGSIYEIVSIVEGWDEELQQQTVAVQINIPAPFLLEKGCTILEFAYFGRFDTDSLSFDYNDIWTSTTALTFRGASDTEIGLVL